MHTFAVIDNIMIERRTVSQECDPLFQFSWELYEASFPNEERRAIDYHIETMAKGQFRAEVILDDDSPIGILFWWDLADFRFIEHLATSPEVRGSGYGEIILRGFIAESSKPIILEVEHPLDDLSRRRIGFYERIGFALNAHPYRHPSYQQIQGEFVELMVMTYPTQITAEVLRQFTNREFSTIHFRRA